MLHNCPIQIATSPQTSRCGKLTRGILFHLDNAPAHRSCECVSALSQHGFKILPHPPYSPDLSPCDFHPFPQIKRQLKGRRFKDIGELKQAFKDAIVEKPTDFFEGAFQTWRHRAEKCVINNGDYVEKWLLFIVNFMYMYIPVIVK